MPHSTKDIRGEACELCEVGRAHVVYFARRKRFFFGCDASTKDKPCEGSKSWQSIHVPNCLRIVPDGIKESDETTKGETETKKSVQQDKPKVKRDKVKEEVPYASKKVKSEAKSEK